MTYDESALEMRWVPVTTDDGRTRMETVWVETHRPVLVQGAA